LPGKAFGRVRDGAPFPTLKPSAVLMRRHLFRLCPDENFNRDADAILA
jgi:hypothetical protein